MHCAFAGALFLFCRISFALLMPVTSFAVTNNTTLRRISPAEFLRIFYCAHLFVEMLSAEMQRLYFAVGRDLLWSPTKCAMMCNRKKPAFSTDIGREANLMTQNFELKQCSVLDAGAEAVVNAANSRLQEGGGVCGAIFRRAGAARLQALCDAIGGCPTGSAVVTSGLKAARWIIHAVGPIYGTPDCENLLADAYQAALTQAAAVGAHSIAFPLISSGIYGFPLDKAAEIALRVLTAPRGDDLHITLCCFAEREYVACQEFLRRTGDPSKE